MQYQKNDPILVSESIELPPVPAKFQQYTRDGHCMVEIDGEKREVRTGAVIQKLEEMNETTLTQAAVKVATEQNNGHSRT